MCKLNKHLFCSKLPKIAKRFFLDFLDCRLKRVKTKKKRKKCKQYTKADFTIALSSSTLHTKKRTSLTKGVPENINKKFNPKILCYSGSNSLHPLFSIRTVIIPAEKKTK